MTRRSFLTEQYGLKGLPFKQRIAVELQLASWVNREDEIKRWNKVLDDALQTPESNYLVFIIGDYGMGKTLSLLKIVDDAKSQRQIFPVYLNLLSEQRPKNPGLDFLQRIFRAIDLNDIKVNKKAVDLIKAEYFEVGKIFEAIFDQDEDKRRLATAYLKGEITPTQNQLKYLGILRKMNDVDIAKEYLIGILYLLKAAGFSTLVISIDEFEYLFSLVPKPSQSVYLALFRGLFDLPIQIPNNLKNNTANIAMFIAISEDGLRRLDELEKIETATGGPIQPLMRRVNDRIALGPLSKEDSQRLIEKRLSLNRIKGKYEDQPLIPFTKDFADYIHRITDGRLEAIIVRCDHVLDMGLEQRIPLLTTEFAIEVFKERGLPY